MVAGIQEKQKNAKQHAKNPENAEEPHAKNPENAEEPHVKNAEKQNVIGVNSQIV